jgi:nitric oxide reductase NorE protein
VAHLNGAAAHGRGEPGGAKARHIPGEAGLWVLLFGDISVFTVLFCVYLCRRGEEKTLFVSSQVHLNRALGGVNTLVLLTSSIVIVFATRAVRNERTRHIAPRLTLVGAAVGGCFVLAKAIEYHQKLSGGLSPSTNDFYMWYYAITGLHLGHVVLGLIILMVLSRLVGKVQPTPTNIAFFEGGACFWHMVDLLWIVIFPLIYLVR